MTKRPSVLTVILASVVVACGGDSPAPEPGAGSQRPAEVVDFRGMYSYMADAPLFTECATGLTYPVAAEAESVVLERAYLELQTGPAEPLLVSVRGYVEPRPRADGGSEDALIVTAFQTVFIGQACEGTASGQPLEGPEWVAIELMGLRPSDEDPPTLTVEPRVGLMGWSGCGGFTGTYRLQGAQLRFSAITPPDIPCTGFLSRVEQAFMQVLQGTGSYEIHGDTLELIGETGVVARFTAP